MRIIENLIDIDLQAPDGEHLLVNSLNGLCDVIHKEEYAIFCNWKRTGSIYASTDRESSLLQTLISRGAVVEDTFDEDDVKEKLLIQLKKKSDVKIKQCNSVIFIFSYGCNFKCPYCYEGSISGHKVMSYNQIDTIFKLHQGNIPNIGFFGGEPLLLGNMERIKYIITKAPEATYSMITNGYHLLDYYEIFKNIKISNIQVTLDGTESVHNKTRILKSGMPTYQRIVDGIRLFAEHSIPLTLRMNATKENLESCIEAKKEIFSNEWAQNIKFEMQPVFQNRDRQLYEDVVNEDYLSPFKNTILKRQNPLVNFIYGNNALRPIVKVCSADYQKRYYDAEGNIYSCVLAVGRPSKRIGTYYPELVYDEDSMLKRDISTIPQCKTCKYAFFCGGGCPNALPDNCDIMRTPNCSEMIEQIEHIIPFLYNLKRGKQ